MLSSTARGLPRFSMTRDRPSSSTRRRSLPKFARASKAVTTIPSFINSPFRLIKLYSSRRIDVNYAVENAASESHYVVDEWFEAIVGLIRWFYHSHVGSVNSDPLHSGNSGTPKDLQKR